MRQILLILFFLSVGTAFGQGSVIITDSNSKNEFDLSGNVFFYEDTTLQLTFDQALSSSFIRKFKQSQNPVFVIDKNAGDHWFLIHLENQTPVFHDLILSINNPQIKEIVFYSSIDSSFQNTGLLYPFYQRPSIFKNFLFELKVSPMAKAQLCFKVSGQGVPQFVPISLTPAKKYMEYVSVHQMINGLYYGLILLTILMIILLWMTEKDKLYLSLLLIVLNLVLIFLWRGQILYQFIFPLSPRFNIVIGKLFTLSALVLYIFLIRNLFQINLHKRIIKIAYRTVLIMGMSLMVISVLFRSNLLFYEGFLSYFLFVVIFWFITIWGSTLQSKREFIFNFAATGLLLLVFGLDLLLKLNIRGNGIYDDYFSKFTLVISFLLIISAFVSKFWNSRIEVFELNKNLEQKVQKRTAQINQQKEELKTQHEELIQQKEILQTQREELRAQKELLQIKNLELEKLSQVTSKTNNLITIFKPSGEIDWFNASFSKIIGLSLDEYLHGEPINFLEVSANKNIHHVLNTCVREKAVVSYESNVKMGNGEIRWFQTTLTPILDDRENIKHLIAIDTDITRMKQYELEIEQQRIDAETQKNLAINRKEELELQQIEIYDSIRYAKRIQTAIMPKVKQIQRDFDDSFVLFLPKDIVSGDFYWYHCIENKYFIAAVDCTGHGVPGAFMSIIGNYLLNSIVIHNGIHEPSEILKHLNRKIKISLKSDGRAQTADGMDVAMVVIDKNNRTIEFAGALRPLYLFSGNQFIELKGDKVPITSSISGTSISSFTSFTNEFKPGDSFYIFSDGIIDQFGGDKGKKFLTKRFKQLLFEINPLQMKDQKEIIKKAFDDWRGNYEQVDDVMVIGIRYTEDI